MATGTGELACTYAALILHDDGIPITAEKISTIVKAASVNVDSFWPGLFAKLCEKKNIEDLILNAGSAGVTVAVAGPAAGGTPDSPPAAAAEEKKEEPKEDSEGEDDFMLDLFG